MKKILVRLLSAFLTGGAADSGQRRRRLPTNRATPTAPICPS